MANISIWDGTATFGPGMTPFGFYDSDTDFGEDAVKAAKFKLIINVVKGFRSNREVSKITVYRRQMIEQDFLQGWKVIPSDGILEKTILYRIERNLKIAERLKRIEDQKAKELEANF